jgi:RNA polymerase sigma-70 factor (ECF subfamily)
LDKEISKELLDLCRRQDNRAQHELYRQCYSFLMSVCSRYTINKEDSESLLNQSFLKILLNIGNYKQEIPFKLWIRKITINTIIDDFRKNKKLKGNTITMDFQSSKENTALYEINNYLKKIDAQEIFDLISDLPEMSKAVFNMFVVDGYSHKEIAKALGIPEGTARWQLNSAKEQLKTKLNKKYDSSYKKAVS